MEIKFHLINTRRVFKYCWRIYSIYDENAYNGGTGEITLLRDHQYFKRRKFVFDG